ncbi:MAG: DUF2851 family protein [Bacteroidales bacterium]|nr:DUF2851 family protein [Bacteroidales bacterium]
MDEDFLQYIWANKLCLADCKKTTDGEEIEVVNIGKLNTDQGPDFFNAQVKIGGIVWAGNIEVHVESDDWYKHHHETDPAYDNVVLHVVYKSCGRDILNSKGRKIPEVMLSISEQLKERRNELLGIGNNGTIKCCGKTSDIPQIVKTSWLDTLLMERLEQRQQRAASLMTESTDDLDSLFYVLLARALGGSINADQMQMLARATPLRILLKHPTPLQTEALLLGQAGLLSNIKKSEATEYEKRLLSEYEFLRAKFGVEPIDASVWKYLRLRPVNFPDVRIVQLAAIVRKIPGNFESTFRGTDAKTLIERLDVSPSEYWENHYRLGVESERKVEKRLGVDARRLIIINALVPYLAHCAYRRCNTEGLDDAIELLKGLKTEKNSIISEWESSGISPRDEGEAQALIHLFKNYCEMGRCLHCRFGHAIMTRK